MTSWEQHHPPHDHPDFAAYLDSLTDDDLATINTTNDTALNATNDGGLDTENAF